MGTKIDMTGKKINKLTVLSISNNRTASGSIKWICKYECGNICEVDGTRLRNGKAKSCGCASKQALKIGQGNNFKDLSGKKFGKIKVLNRIENKIYKNRSFVQYKCQCECGRYLNVIGCNLSSGNTQSCGKCNENSHGNLKIDNILTKANIPFQREKRFNTCKDKMPLPFDFYVNNQYLIQYDGNYHFIEKNTIFDKNKAQKHDKIKNEWCHKNNIPLIRIPYTQYENLSLTDLLLETSNFIVKKMPTINCGIKRES